MRYEMEDGCLARVGVDWSKAQAHIALLRRQLQYRRSPEGGRKRKNLRKWRRIPYCSRKAQAITGPYGANCVAFPLIRKWLEARYAYGQEIHRRIRDERARTARRQG